MKKRLANWHRELLKFLGIASIILSMILAIAPRVLTGYSVMTAEVGGQFRILAIIFFIGGLVLLWISHSEERREVGTLEREVESEERGLLAKEGSRFRKGFNKIDVMTYKDFLEKRKYEYEISGYTTHLVASYEHDRREFLERLKGDKSEAARYLQQRVEERNRDAKSVEDINRILHPELRLPIDRKSLESARDTLLARYESKEIDEARFAEELNGIGGMQELTGGVFNPGKNHLSVRFGETPITLTGQGSNKKLALAIYSRIMENSPTYMGHCQFHFGKGASSKHHARELKELASK